LCIISLFVILLISLLVLPFSLSIKVERTETTVGYQIAIRYPWKLIGIGLGRDAGQRKMRILIGNRSVYEPKRREKKTSKGKSKKEKKPQKDKKLQKEKKSKKDKPKRKFGDFMKYSGLIREIARPAIQFLKDILRCLKKARIAGDLEGGISDPALMGILYGVYWAIPWRKQHDLKVNPNFVDATFSGWVEIETYVTLLSISYAVIKLAFKVPIIKLIRMRRQKKTGMEETN